LKSLQVLHTLDCIEDTNNSQEFIFSNEMPSRFLKITFNSSTDFYGRITIYDLKIFGIPSLHWFFKIYINIIVYIFSIELLNVAF
jgi:hypothetical protein